MNTRHEVHRDDGELVGFVRPAGGGWVTETVFGHELDRFDYRADAETSLAASGLAYLVDRWRLTDGDLAVQIIEASPERVTVLVIDFGASERYGERISLDAPVGDGLRREP
ncbi:hypothetical protein BHE97_09480 [Aeromicrobium sp. PE09-221]|uniref:hypothetical protein n=1 Tax=Aeromicrobium sp. PE09-221 TaxID=1898043 RepID=UPI000B3ECE71|nr:hypothetical protein [Aeromicrobium sp. PE09-221]OUZ09689.1 hypothetical protein BHE97_09480 [Aeromicrobium sp. PE09-221]